MKTAYAIGKRFNVQGLKTPFKVEIISVDGGIYTVRTMPTEYDPYVDDEKEIYTYGTECFEFRGVSAFELLMEV